MPGCDLRLILARIANFPAFLSLFPVLLPGLHTDRTCRMQMADFYLDSRVDKRAGQVKCQAPGTHVNHNEGMSPTWLWMTGPDDKHEFPHFFPHPRPSPSLGNEGALLKRSASQSLGNKRLGVLHPLLWF